MAKYSHIVFMQDDEGSEVVDRLTRCTDGFTVYGPTAETIAEAIEYLSQWDYGDDYDVRDEPSAGTSDDTVREGEYLLTWNTGLGYVGLERVITE